MFHRRNTFVVCTLTALCAAPCLLHGTVILDPTAPAGLTLYSLGTAPDVAASYTNAVEYEGLAISGNNLLLSVANAATAVQTIWSLPLIRSNSHIVGLGSIDGSTQVLGYPADQPERYFGNVMAGGLVPVSGGLIYTTFANSFLGQNTGGSTTLLDLTPTGALTGGLQYVPAGFTGAGQLKASSTDANGTWYTLNLNGSLGSYSIGSFTPVITGVQAFSFDYIPVDATFTAPGVALGDAIHQRLDFYGIDSNGNPCTPQNGGCSKVIHLVDGDVQVGLGVVRDPVTGDLLFTTGANDIWLLSDSEPEPSTVVLAVGGIAMLGWLRRRRLVSRNTPER